MKLKKEDLKEIYSQIKPLIDEGVLRDVGILSDDYQSLKLKRDELRKRLSDATFPLLHHLFKQKNKAFSEENEWRIVSVLWEGRRDLVVEFQAFHDKIKPYRSLDLEDLGESPISVVYKGPKNKTPIHVIKRLLEQNGFYDVAIKRSKASSYR